MIWCQELSKRNQKNYDIWSCNTVQKIIKQYWNTPKFYRKHKNIIYFDISEDWFSLEPKLHHIENNSPAVEVVQDETENIYTNEKVSEILKKSEYIQFFYDQLYELGFSGDEIDILIELDREKIQSEIFRVENDAGIDINVYSNAEWIFEHHKPRDLRKLIERMWKSILDKENYSCETFILTLIVKSIAAMENILDTDKLTIEQREMTARFAIVSAFRLW